MVKNMENNKTKKIPYGVLAWRLNEIISHMNDEEAYYGSWLYIWPDGETMADCNSDFGDKESYKELEESFIRKYKAYHSDGICIYKEEDRKILKWANAWDKKLGLEKIKVFGLEG